MALAAEVRFEPTLEEWVALYERGTRRVAAAQNLYGKAWRNGILGGLIPGGVLMAVMYTGATVPDRAWFSAVAFGLTFAVMWVVYALLTLTRRAVNRRLRRSIERGIAGGVLRPEYGPMRVAVEADALVVETPGTTISTAWDAVESVEDAGDALYVDYRSGGCVRVPRRAFASEGQKAAFLGAIETALAGRHPA